MEIMIMKAVILAGGLGTRLKSVSGDLPKPMVPVEGRPFLEHLMEWLSPSVSGFILSTGYRAELVSRHFSSSFKGLSVDYCVEDSPLGTGGAIRKVFESFSGERFFLINGDTFFAVNLKEMDLSHMRSGSLMSMALKPMKNFERYGNVGIKDGHISSFEEKRFVREGLINGGIYVLERSLAKYFPVSEKFSFEKDVLEKHIADLDINPFLSDSAFIDIGIPEDYLSIRDNAAIFRL